MLNVFHFLLYQRSSILQDIYFLYCIQFVSELSELNECVNTQKSRKQDEHGESFQSSPKINCMLITRLICIQWKFTTSNQLASSSTFIKIVLFFDHWSNHLFQSNQQLQVIEFVADPFKKSWTSLAAFYA